VEGFLREMWEHGDIGPSYATEISDDARVAVSRKRARSLVKCTRGGEPKGKMAKQRRRSGGSDLVRRARRS
jgi:hypothetical protein